MGSPGGVAGDTVEAVTSCRGCFCLRLRPKTWATHRRILPGNLGGMSYFRDRVQLQQINILRTNDAQTRERLRARPEVAAGCPLIGPSCIIPSYDRHQGSIQYPLVAPSWATVHLPGAPADPETGGTGQLTWISTMHGWCNGRRARWPTCIRAYTGPTSQIRGACSLLCYIWLVDLAFPG